jgi:hypothetical protein
MNFHILVIGILTSLLIINLFKHSATKNSQALYAWYLASFFLYYCLFALYAANFINFIQELMVGFIFLGLARSTLALNPKEYSLILTIGYFLHAIYDFSHALFFINSGVPFWWPDFSGVINLTLGVYLATFIFKQKYNQLIFTGG